MLHFHPRSTNPELWRTTVPLVVRQRCQRHKGLIATWTAIHWLIVVNAASGRAHFGMREIAEEAGVGRNELAGEAGYIQRLVKLGLIRIVGHKFFRNLREPRPIYHVDLAELERLSLELVPDVLREHNIDRPPPAAPDPRQLRLAMFQSDQDDDPASGHCSPAESEAESAPSDSYQAGRRQHTPEFGTEPAPARSTLAQSPAQTLTACGSGTAKGQALLRNQHVWPESGTEQDQASASLSNTGREVHEFGTATLENRRGALENEQDTPVNGTHTARNRDMDGKKERMIEGESLALTPNFLRSIIAQTTEAVLATLQAQGTQFGANVPPILNSLPTPPQGAEPLTASVLSLWCGDAAAPRSRDIHQLALLIAEYDGPTGGYGAYWLGRAILMADLCLGDREQPITIAYLRRMLRRWREEESWGSDRGEIELAPRPAAEPSSRARPGGAQPHREAMQHPAVCAYVEAMQESPNSVQALQIAETVTDIDSWNQVLTDWQLNGWGERGVGKMLDRYKKTCSGTAAPEPPPSISAIHTYPGLTPEQRDRWIRKFHAAANPAEKRAVLARLEQEHPR